MVTDNIQDYMSSIKKYIKETQFEQYTDDELYSLFVPCIWASVSYMMMTRCGINAREKIDIKEFEYIKYFNSEKVNIKEGDYEFDRTKYYSLNDTQQKAVVENDLVSINKNYDYFDYLIDNGYKDTNDLWKFYAILYDGSIICSPFETVDDAILNGFCYFKFTGNLDDIIYHTQGKSLTKTMN